jgi:hypothetical protein
MFSSLEGQADTHPIDQMDFAIAEQIDEKDRASRNEPGLRGLIAPELVAANGAS